MSDKRNKKADTSSDSPVGKRGNTTGVYAPSYRVINVMTIELERLLVETNARCALVIDRTGCIMAEGGEFGSLNPSNLGATAAATVAALNSMVSRATTPEVSVDFYGSEVDRIHFVVLEQRLILCLIHSRNVGTADVRVAARHFVDAVSAEIAEDRARRPNRKPTKEEKDVVKSVGFIESKLDELFGDASSFTQSDD